MVFGSGLRLAGSASGVDVDAAKKSPLFLTGSALFYVTSCAPIRPSHTPPIASVSCARMLAPAAAVPV